MTAWMLLGLLQGTGQEPPIPVPEADAQRKAEKLIREVFAEDYSKKDANSRRAFAQKLLRQALDSKDDAASRYVLLREAVDVAAQAGDVTSCLSATDEMGRAFEVQPLALKKASLEKVRKLVVAPADFGLLAEAYLDLGTQSLKAADFDLAGEAAREAEAAAQKGKSIPLLGKARSLAKEVADSRLEASRIEQIRKKLAGDPSDPEANLVMGRHHCLKLGNWDQGLPLLAKGSDALLKALAVQDLARPKDGPELVKLGDGWWDAGEKEAGVSRDSCRQRAAHWYRGALPGASGLTRVRIEKRIPEAPPDPKAGRNLSGLIGWWTFDEGSGDVARDSSGRQNHGKLMNSIQWVQGRSGTALGFDGVDDHVVLSAAGMPAANAPQTLSWHQRYVSIPGLDQHIITLSSESPRSSLQPAFRNGRVAVWKYGGSFLVSVAVPEDKAWHHYAYTFDGTTHRLYLDGALKESSTVAPDVAKPQKFEIGRWWDPAIAGYFTGMMDDLRIFDRALAEEEVRAVSMIK